MRTDFWPPSLAHLASPYLRDTDDEVVIGEISSEPVNGFSGHRRLFTALVPVPELQEVLSTLGGIGPEVECWGPHPCVPPEGGHEPRFWIAGNARRYETLIDAWLNHNKLVVLPDNGLLMCYGRVVAAAREHRYLRVGVVGYRAFRVRAVEDDAVRERGDQRHRRLRCERQFGNVHDWIVGPVSNCFNDREGQRRTMKDMFSQGAGGNYA